MHHQRRPIIAIATGDPAGIGPEIALKPALDPGVRAVCRPLLVTDPNLLVRHAQASSIGFAAHVVTRVDKAEWLGQADNHINILDCPQPYAATLPFGVTR